MTAFGCHRQPYEEISALKAEIERMRNAASQDEAMLKKALDALETCVCAMQDYQAGIGITEMFDEGERIGRAQVVVLRERLK